MNRHQFALSAAATLAAATAVRQGASAAAFTFKWGHATQPEHPLAVNAVRVRDEVRRRSGGRL